MRLIVVVVVPALCLLAVPAAAQRAPLAKLLDKVLPGPVAPRVALPATPDIPALTRPAERTVPGDVWTFDLGGFRLGMSEDAVSATAKARGLIVRDATRVVSFESQVRSLINVRGGTGGPETGKGVLGEATLRDAAGGSYVLHMLVWPDGAHVRSITYLAPQGTATAEWRRMLVEKWGRPREEGGAGSDQLRARWGATDASGVRASADVGPRGGTVTVESPDGAGGRASQLVEQAADTFFASNAKKPSL